jgi:hypothetical protein
MRLPGAVVMSYLPKKGLIHDTVNITYDFYELLLTKLILYLSNLVVKIRFSSFN